MELSRVLADLGYNTEIPYPDLSTKAKAQTFIGLPMNKLNNEKQAFKQTVIPKWVEAYLAKYQEEVLQN